MEKVKMAVYRKDKNGNKHLIKRSISIKEAVVLANKHLSTTGETALILKEEKEKNE